MIIGTGGYVEIGGLRIPVTAWSTSRAWSEALSRSAPAVPSRSEVTLTVEWCLSQYARDRLGLELARRTRPFVARPRRLVGWLFPGDN